MHKIVEFPCMISVVGVHHPISAPHPTIGLQPVHLPRQGWLRILLMVLQLKPGALLIGGPPCGSFVWINRSTSKRSKTRLLGTSALSYVRDANS